MHARWHWRGCYRFGGLFLSSLSRRTLLHITTFNATARRLFDGGRSVRSPRRPTFHLIAINTRTLHLRLLGPFIYRPDSLANQFIKAFEIESENSSQPKTSIYSSDDTKKKNAKSKIINFQANFLEYVFSSMSCRKCRHAEKFIANSYLLRQLFESMNSFEYQMQDLQVCFFVGGQSIFFSLDTKRIFMQT